MSRRPPGHPIPGTEKTVSAAAIAAALGLRPGSAPKEDGAPGMTPNQARKLMADEWPGETPDIGWETHVIPGGRDAAAALGVDLAKLPVGVEAELGPPQPRPERRPERESSRPPRNAESDAAKATQQAEQIRQRVAADVERAKARVRAAGADGTPLEERQAAAKDAHDTVAFARKIADRIKEKVSR